MNWPKRHLINTFLAPQFNYCSLVLMWHRLKSNKKINKLQELCFQIIVANSYHFNSYWQKSGCVSVHNWHLQKLGTEAQKVNTGLSSTFRHVSQFDTLSVKDIYHGIKIIFFLRTKICILLPKTFKKTESL